MKHAKLISSLASVLLLSVIGNGQKLLFNSDTILNIKLRGNIKELLSDRGDKPEYHPITLYYSMDTGIVAVLVRAKTRGHFRKAKENCGYPPLLINVAKQDQPAASLFYKQDKIKLVMPCRGDEYVVREWLVYKLYNIVSPKSFKARLVKVSLEDMQGKTKPAFYGILLEDEKDMAKRNGLVPVDKTAFRPEYTERKDFLTMAVFEYLIGNTDWSVQYLQNVKLVATDSTGTPMTVPYDFDHAGIVSAPYAKPAEELQMTSVKERRYRGFCVSDMKVFDLILDHFLALKKEIYDLYVNCPLIDTRYKKDVTGYFNEFYSIISDAKKAEKEFRYPCDPNGTGNVVIKGLRED